MKIDRELEKILQSVRDNCERMDKATERFIATMDERLANHKTWLERMSPETKVQAVEIMANHPGWGWLDALAYLEKHPKEVGTHGN